MDIEEMLKNTDLAINIIDELGKLLVRCINMPEEALTVMLGSGVLSVIPDVVESYRIPIMAGRQEEIQVWETQFERIIAAIRSRDRFFLLDVLINETKLNLMEYKKAIQGAVE